MNSKTFLIVLAVLLVIVIGPLFSPELQTQQLTGFGVVTHNYSYLYGTNVVNC